jgi:hypothetical protein
MGKKQEPEIVSLPCPVKRCMWNSMVALDLGREISETNKRYYMQRTLNELLEGHQDGRHNYAQCCCCHHSPCTNTNKI